MKRNNEPSWSVVTEATEELNFAIYVCCTYDLLPKNKPFSQSKQWTSTEPSIELAETERAALESQWNHWWDHLVSVRSQHGRNFDFYSPSYFESLDKELGKLCRASWQAFRDWWHMSAGGNIAMIHWESADNVGQYVKEFEREVMRTVKPFHIRVDLVYAGVDDLVEVSDEYVIMPIRSPRENKSWWSQKSTP